MHIIIEGPDGTGKSTLASVISECSGFQVIRSPGPPRPSEDINDRIRTYLGFPPGTIIDRHPIVSDMVYSTIRGKEPSHDPDMVAQFYGRSNLIIYCRSVTEELTNHEERPGVDTPQHIDLIKRKHQRICVAYDKWALEHARLVYRIGDNLGSVLCAAMGVIKGEY